MDEEFVWLVAFTVVVGFLYTVCATAIYRSQLLTDYPEYRGWKGLYKLYREVFW